MWLTPTAEVPVAARVFLLVQVRKGAVTRIPIANPVVRLGRGPDCDVVIPHPRVSRLHAILELRDGAYHVSDARSTGGTFLGDHPVTGPVRLSSGDTLRLGRNPTDCATVVYHEER